MKEVITQFASNYYENEEAELEVAIKMSLEPHFMEGMNEVITQFTSNYYENEEAELEMAIKMSLEPHFMEGMNEAITQFTSNYYENEEAELEMAIKMSLEPHFMEVTGEISSADCEEGPELQQAMCSGFISALKQFMTPSNTGTSTSDAYKAPRLKLENSYQQLIATADQVFDLMVKTEPDGAKTITGKPALINHHSEIGQKLAEELHRNMHYGLENIMALNKSRYYKDENIDPERTEMEQTFSKSRSRYTGDDGTELTELVMSVKELVQKPSVERTGETSLTHGKRQLDLKEALCLTSPSAEMKQALAGFTPTSDDENKELEHKEMDMLGEKFGLLMATIDEALSHIHDIYQTELDQSTSVPTVKEHPLDHSASSNDEDEKAELEMTINALLKRSPPEFGIDHNEQIKLDNALFLLSFPPCLPRLNSLTLECTNPDLTKSLTELKKLTHNLLDSEDLKKFERGLQLKPCSSECVNKQLNNISQTMDNKELTVNILSPPTAQELATLSEQLIKYFQHSLNHDAVKSAVHIMTEVIEATPNSHANKNSWLNTFGTALLLQFQLSNTVLDYKNLDQAVLIQQQAVDLTLDGNANKPSYLTILAGAFRTRFQCSGKVADIEKAITLLQQAVDLTPDGHANKPRWLDELGTSLQGRFERLNELTDLEQAIGFQQQVVCLTPDGDAQKPFQLSNLGTAFQRRFHHLGELSDIEKAIDVHQQAVSLTPAGHTQQPIWLKNLADSFNSRFRHLGQLPDLEKVISVMRQANDLIYATHPKKPVFLTSLGDALLKRFEHLGVVTDLEQAIDANQRAVILTPHGHSDKPLHLVNLGYAFLTRFKCLANASDYHHGLCAFQTACVPGSGYPSIQLTAALQWAHLCFDPYLVMQAYERMFQLIPQVVWLGQTVDHRYQELPQIGRAVNTAVAVAISVSNFPKAVEWFEEGRGIVWGQILQLRSPLDDLQALHPQLVQDFLEVSRALEKAGTSTRSNRFDNSNVHANSTTREQEAQVHTQLADEYERLVNEIRKLDGFGSFLKPKKLSELAAGAHNGPIVMVNVAQSRCDALILFSSSSIIHVPLPTFSSQHAAMLCSKLVTSLQAKNVRTEHNGDRLAISSQPKVDHFQVVLNDLWVHVVQPVISGLEGVHVAKDHLPRITWCAAGSLAFLPLHAAGVYGSVDHTRNVDVSDFVVSSYTTTLTAILNSGTKSRQYFTTQPSVLIVSQPATPSMTPLPGTLEEVKIIRNYTPPNHTLHLTNSDATVEAVIKEMSKHEIVHLACHGIQDLNSPLDSAFALHNGSLRLKALMGVSLKNVQLAILSACQTATGDENLPEEAVHLAAGMLAVGYPSVIATMWAIGDQDAPRVASKIYESLFGKHGYAKGRSSAHALHEAVKHLRQEVGERNFVKWVPFIHFGA
ncbi:hypothetical protein BT96DRAFT_917303 [Gymnopus androsaceus JB14]|uniref:CHAT domain-containing protein n=1 Tax=Gymnopus androsaceus JB14 TaxID=1447944 RepID=A0A6A4HZV4_9AGAR|nr:hypothetical protein BT96DRAFT_917303 [Gymnopus androsaceus JB14]